jgi:hypothetical protein
LTQRNENTPLPNSVSAGQADGSAGVKTHKSGLFGPTIIVLAVASLVMCLAAGIAALVALVKTGIEPVGFSNVFYKVFIGIMTFVHPLPFTACAISAVAVYFAYRLVVLRARRVLAGLYRLSRWERSQTLAELRADAAPFSSINPMDPAPRLNSTISLHRQLQERHARFPQQLGQRAAVSRFILCVMAVAVVAVSRSLWRTGASAVEAAHSFALLRWSPTLAP